MKILFTFLFGFFIFLGAKGQCSIVNNYGPGAARTFNTIFERGQSFTAHCNGQITSITMNIVGADMVGDGQVRL